METNSNQGYGRWSLFQQTVLNILLPYVSASTRSLNEYRDDASFVAVDYGAADGLNSVPLIAACSDELSSEVSEFEWIFNDLSNSDNIQKVEDQLNLLPGWEEGSVKLQYLDGSFYNQVVPDESVDLGVSVSAIHWLSQRPPKDCSTDPRYPDDATKAISAKDWVDFLQCRGKELKKGGRLLIAVFTTGDNLSKVKEDIRVGRQRVIKDMFDEGIITKEEYEFARVFPMSYRTEADLRAPFRDPESDLSQILCQVNIKTYDVPCPFYCKWMKAGGRENISATEEFVIEHVNLTKRYYNLVWKILEVTRSREVHLSILDIFYKRVEQMVCGNLEGYHTNESVSVVDIIKY